MKHQENKELSGRLLCGVCFMHGDVDETAYIFPEEHLAPGICRQCKELPPTIQQAFFGIHLNVITPWLRMHRDTIQRALFSEN